MGQFTANNPDPALRVDKNGTVLYANVAEEPFLHYWGTKVGTQLPPDIRDIVQRALAQNTTEKIEVQGTERKYLIEFHPLFEEECVNIYGSEINDLKATEKSLSKEYERISVQPKELLPIKEELRAQSRELYETNRPLHDIEAGFRTLAENSPDLITRFDRHDNCLYANSKAQADYEIVKLSQKRRENVFVTGKPEEIEFLYISTQGKVYIFDTKIVPEFVNGEVNGKVSSVLVISRDITSERNSEANLKKTSCNLEKLVKKRTAELEEAYNLLKESEKGLAEAQKMAHIGNWNWNLLTNQFYYSDELYRIFGLNPQEFDVSFEEVLAYIHPEDRDYVTNSILEALNGKVYDAIDFRIILADGTERIIHTQGEVIFDERNMPVRMRGTVQDITERRQIDDALRESEQKYRNIIETTNEGISIIDAELKVTYINKRMEEMLGYSSEEAVGKSLWNILSEESKTVIDLILRNGLQGVNESLEIKIVRKDGSPLWAHVNAKSLFDNNGKFMGLLNMLTDITERKKAVEKLRESEESLAEAQRIAHIGNWEWDAANDTAYWSEEMYRIFGLDPQAIAPGLNEFFKYIHPEDWERKKNNIMKKLKGDNGAFDYRIILASGEERIVYTQVEVIFNEEKVPLRVKGIVQDITERKKSEEKIKRLADIVESSNDAIITISLEGDITSWNKGAEQVYGYLTEEVLSRCISILEPNNLKGEIKQLAAGVKQGKNVKRHETSMLKKDGTAINVSLTLSPIIDQYGKLVAISCIGGDITEKKIAEKLLQEKKMAEVANRTKSDFLAKMSHELRTPLNSIIGFSEMLHEQAYGEMNEKQLRVTGYISKSGKHLLNLINNILDISKVEAGKMELNYKNFELVARLNMIRNLLSPIADRKNTKIEIDVESTLTNVLGDEDKFAQIMYNLVDNAIKFSYEDSVIKIGARKKGELAEITVKDTGIGIKAEDQKKLFKPFSQIDSFSSRKSQGTGLGLSLVKQIVHLHGGYVWYRSVPGKGSTFAFAIPITNDNGDMEIKGNIESKGKMESRGNIG